ncbi:hypothetical protein BC834DRAFT_1037375 [Gloeopeniophorella convolvens]|nr:hypothetical protein BC834DRAFT_1037375 [Gloeopeniophorella convolvens]
MVRFGWPTKGARNPTHPTEQDNRRPPPYQEEDHAPPLVFPGTTATTTRATTTTTTTTQTAHFLSLPLWRRRQENPVSSQQRRSMSDVRTGEQGLVHQPDGVQAVFSRREKSLPPTPASSSEDISTSHSSSAGPTRESQSQSRQPVMHTLQSVAASPAPVRPSPSQATVALAHAALAIGLPHSMPQVSASSSRSDVNSLVIMAAPQSDQHPFPSPGVRRAKSFQQLSGPYDREDAPSTSLRPRRRSRGVSFGRSNAFDPNEKGKGREVEDIPSHVTPPRKSLVRRASFWSRKRNNSLKNAVAPLPSPHPDASSSHLSHTLPSLPPVSPFHVDTNISTSSHSSQTEEQGPPLPPPGLSLLDDPRSRPLPPDPDPIVDSPISTHSPIPRPLRRRRPSTADSTADRSRTLSFLSPDSSLSTRTLLEQRQDGVAQVPVTRPRSQTNPPFLHRLSVNLFSFGSSVPSSSVSVASGIVVDQSPVASPRNSVSKIPQVPKPQPDGETPAEYVERLLSATSKSEVASLLAASGDDFYSRALQAYVDRFEFSGAPLDVALRMLLMDVGLPRETQQIDRVMEAFANRYLAVNPSLFASDDHPYIIAFSLIMLHTDAFNKSNKRKMTKADYIKNTTLPGVFPEILDYYYDNIVFAPFIFVEDPLEANPSRNPISESSSSRLLSSITAQSSLPGNGSSVTLLGKSNKIDPYYLIAKNLLGPLRVDVEAYVPRENPYSYEGTSGPWDEAYMHEMFLDAGIIEVGGPDRRMSTSVFALSVGGIPTPYANLHPPPDSVYHPRQVSALRVVKVGLLNCKDITLDFGKRAKAGKWRIWSVILTGSQLLLFRDHAWAINLQKQMASPDRHRLSPPAPVLKPDEVLPLKDSVALYDRSDDKHHNSFLLTLSSGRHILLQAPSEKEMNSWLSFINYASAYRSAGIPLRAPGLSGKDVELMGVAAAASHLRELQFIQAEQPTSAGRNSDDFIDRLSAAPAAPSAVLKPRRLKTVSGRDDMDLDAPTAPTIAGAHQFKAAFDQVKADLAAGRSADDFMTRPDERPRAHSLESATRPRFRSVQDELESEQGSARTMDIRSKLVELEARTSRLQLDEESHLRMLRNIAVLTPFQRATRERLGLVVLHASKTLLKIRLDLAMLLCRKEILSNDLIAQEREWTRTKRIALKAATDTLQSRREPSISRRPPPLRVDQSAQAAGPSDEFQHLPSPSLRPESSVAESFHSALDFDWPLTALDGSHEGVASSDSPGAIGPSEMSTDSLSPLPSSQSNDGSWTPELVSHERFITAPEGPDEEAEEWNKTRAAKRVSLVRTPSTLNVAFGRHGSSSATGSHWTVLSPRLAPSVS